MNSEPPDESLNSRFRRDAQSTVKEVDAWVVHARARLDHMKSTLDDNVRKANIKFSDRTERLRIKRAITEAAGASESAFNVAAEAADGGAGIGARAPPMEKKEPLSKAELQLRKALIGSNKDNGKRTVSSREDEGEEELTVEAKAPVKRRQNAFLDEVIAERKGKKRDKQ